jgi:cation:H+ antiporter
MSAAADWSQFAACALMIGYAGAELTRLADAIGEKTGLSRSWLGLLLLAAVTSLPELATGISAVTVAGAPDIAIGDVLGSTVFNLALLVLLDLLYRPDSIYTRASHEHVLSAAFGVVLLSMVGAGLLLEREQVLPVIGHVGSYTPLLVVLYLVAMRSVFVQGRRQAARHGEAPQPPPLYGSLSLRRAIIRFVLSAVVVAAAGTWLPFVAVRIADDMGWSRTFVGTLFVAAATSVPEIVVTVAALRLGALDMAIASLLGSNLFDILIVALDDLFYAPAPILSAVAPVHAVTAFSAAMMSGAVIIGLVYRPKGPRLRAPGIVSLALLAVYLLNVYVLFTHGR